MNTMSDKSDTGCSRRRFLATMSAVGAASFFGLPRPAAAEPPPETTSIRLVHAPAICLAPQYLAEELLHLEGFSDVTYVDNPTGRPNNSLATGQADFTQDATSGLLPALDAGQPIVGLAGIHVGCYELFGNDRVRAVRDLKGKTIAISTYGSPEHILLASILAYVGINPRMDVQWLPAPQALDSMLLFVEGRADAFMGFAPQPQELRARQIGRVILNTAVDRPWSQYYCCMVVAHRAFVTKYPVATKRALRAFLKATDMCAQEPEHAARMLVAKGYEPRYDIAIEVLQSLPYNRWRDAHPEDTLRFHALRLHEVGMIKTSPQKLITQGTDWRFVNELKREMKT
jgi:NitT/TauT family transport system substrate-binding protein